MQIIQCKTNLTQCYQKNQNYFKLLYDMFRLKHRLISVLHECAHITLVQIR